ncbi:MAG: choice-of-anchor tandem repeat GloVer-containing protein [Terriglobales bacterium]
MNISAVAPKFGSTVLAAAALRGALTLAVLSAVLLIAARPAQAQTEKVLYNFCPGGGSCTDGAHPTSRLTFDGAGDLYGTTMFGGLGAGTVFELSQNGSGGWNETVLHRFVGGDGAWPYYSYVIFDSLGNLYGTAYGNGTCCIHTASLGADPACGVVFELSPPYWTVTVLHSFEGKGMGCRPVNGLIMDPAGNLYGITEYLRQNGGARGAVFELSPSAGGWTEQVIYTACTSYAGLTMDAAGNIFGVGCSHAFELSPNSSGGWTPTIIHTFTGGKDGDTPEGTPVLDRAGNLYGTTEFGGDKNLGTVYKLSPGKKWWKEKILYSFKSGEKDGNIPAAGIVFDAAGNIYGTTSGGGDYGLGTVFELVAPVGKGSYKERILWSFGGPDGGRPFDSLILDNAGNLYGTASQGGSGGYGVVFEVTP